jgi:hypothetical protein
MKLIKTKTIGEHTIIDGLGIPAIDPKETQKKCLPMIKKTAEAENCNQKIAAKASKESAAAKAFNEARILLDNGKKSEADLKNAEYRMHLDHAKTCNSELIELNRILNLKARDILKKNPVYFSAKPNEIFLPENDETNVLIDKWMGKAQNKQILIDGNEIDDFRGCQYFYQIEEMQAIPLDQQTDIGKWVESEVITDLGVDKNTVVADDYYQDQAIEKKDLTPEQSEEIRIQFLSPEDKEAEKNAKIDEVLQESIKMRSGLEIQGIEPAQALSDSQAWYNNQVNLIEAKYA